jgi:hypothetical protein
MLHYKNHKAECHFAMRYPFEWHSVEWHFVVCYYYVYQFARCHYAFCHSYECHSCEWHFTACNSQSYSSFDCVSFGRVLFYSMLWRPLATFVSTSDLINLISVYFFAETSASKQSSFKGDFPTRKRLQPTPKTFSCGYYFLGLVS